VPVLKHFLKVKGTFEMATNATVKSPPTILAHFYLSSYKHTAHFTIVEQLMAEYYHEDDSQILMMDLPFDLGSNQDVEKWNADAAKRLANISPYSHVVVFVTTHSDPDRGDLWFGYDKDKNPCAAEADEVSGLFYHFILILIMNLTVASNSPWPFQGHRPRLHALHDNMWSCCKSHFVL